MEFRETFNLTTSKKIYYNFLGKYCFQKILVFFIYLKNYNFNNYFVSCPLYPPPGSVLALPDILVNNDFALNILLIKYFVIVVVIIETVADPVTDNVKNTQ